MSRNTLISIVLIVLITFAASFTPIAIRITQAQGVPSLAIVFMRLFIAPILMFPVVWNRYSEAVRKITRRQWLWGLAAGFWFSINIVALFFALEFSSVLVTGVFRRTTPVWTILPEMLFLGVMFTWRTWTSAAVSVAGVVLITLGNAGAVNAGVNPVLGATIALMGAFFIGMYLLIGRKLSSQMPSLVYSWMVFSCAGMFVTIFVISTGTPLLGYTLKAYGWILIVTVLSQYIGHISINLGLRYFSATAMSIILELSVVMGAVLAFFQFGEVPSFLQVIGSALIIGGVVLASTERRAARQASK